MKKRKYLPKFNKKKIHEKSHHDFFQNSYITIKLLHFTKYILQWS